MLLIGRDLSPFVRRTAIVMATVNVPFERQVLAAIEDGAQLAPHTPLGRVPVLILEDGETLIDSAAIIDHILEVGDPTPALLPATGHDRRRVLYLCAIATGAMEKGVASSYERFQRPRELIHGPWLDRLFDQARGGLAALEAALGERDWLHGDAMTLADIYAVVLYDFMQIIDLPRLEETARAALPALSARLNALPAFQDHRFIPAGA